jgi:hypothetical protein
MVHLVAPCMLQYQIGMPPSFAWSKYLTLNCVSRVSLQLFKGPSLNTVQIVQGLPPIGLLYSIITHFISQSAVMDLFQPRLCTLLSHHDIAFPSAIP